MELQHRISGSILSLGYCLGGVSVRVPLNFFSLPMKSQ